MKRMTVVSAAAMLAAIAFGSPLYAASTDAPHAQMSRPAPGMADATSTRPSTSKTSMPGGMDKDAGETVDTHIKHLHDTLQITAAQEGMWKEVAQVMRDNAGKMSALAKARNDKASTMTAVDDLKSYAEITEAHEVGVEKLLPVFTSLYNGLSDAQKKAADAEFRDHHHHEGHS